MPHIAISMIPGRSREAKKELALKVQEFVCDQLELDSSIVSVSVEDILKENWEEHRKAFPKENIYTD